MAMQGKNTRHGQYTPVFPEKCMNLTVLKSKPTWRSKWEATVFRALDTNEVVLKWGSELPSCIIEYISPIDRQKHRYFPDFYVEIVNRAGTIDRWVVEVKPLEECSPPERPKRNTENARKQFAVKMQTWLVNEAKWKAAKPEFAKRGIRFMVATQDTIYKKLTT